MSKKRKENSTIPDGLGYKLSFDVNLRMVGTDFSKKGVSLFR